MDEMNIEFNNVKYEVKSLIEFSSLAKLLLDLSKRQKEIEQNISSINTSINDKDNRLSILEKKISGKMEQEEYIQNIFPSPDINKIEINEQIPNNEKNFDSLNKDIILKKEKEDNIYNDNINHNNEENNNDNYENNNIGNNKDFNDKENKNINVEENNNQNEKNNKDDIRNDNKENISENKKDNHYIKLDTELISKLYKKVIDLEKKIEILDKKTNKDISSSIETNKDNIRNINNKIVQYDQNIEEITQKLFKFKEDFDKVKIKVEDFNIYDILKGESDKGGNIDINNALLKTLENKIFKKFELYDEKNKKNEEDSFKTGENIKNLKGLIDGMKNIIQRNSDKIKENENIFNEYNNKIIQVINELKKKIELIENQLPKEEIKNNSDQNIILIEERINKLLEKQKTPILMEQNKENQPQIIQKLEEFDNTMKVIKKSINLLEKNLEKKIYDNNKEIYDKISLLEKEIQLKINFKDLAPINDKLYNLEEALKTLNSQMDAFQKCNDKFRSDITNLFKKLEYFDGEIFQLKSEKEKNSSSKKNNGNFENYNFLSFPIFNQYKKEINSKLEKIKTDLENLSNNLETISSSLNSFTKNKDFSKFQNSIANFIEDIKINFNKKYMERSEIQKALKLIDNQIKILKDTKKYEGSDTWLIAKKPMSNYQCASCESNLKELEQKDNYIPWNKYPNREDKTYRIGHGYSRILEMVNEEIIKNFENRDNKGYVSDDDKKSGSSKNNSKNKDKNILNESNRLIEKKLIKLPKVNKKILNITSEKIKNNTSNNFEISNIPYKITDPSNHDEPKVTKIYKMNNKKNFGFFKKNNEKDGYLNNNIMERINKSSNKEKKNDNLIKMNLTMPDNN